MATEDGEDKPNATVYVGNLDERVKLPRLIETLRDVFEEYGTIIDVIARKNIKAKGQAFIVYDSIESAQDAIDELNGFEVLGQQMRLEFAKTRSDATVKREEGEDGLEVHKRHRLAEKERKQAVEAQNQKPTTKRPADSALAERPVKKPTTAPTGVVPDEYLPPNKTLFLRDVPEDYSKEALTVVFNRFPGFREVRTVPGRKNIAFVEYEAEDGAISAKESTAGMTLGEKSIRVTFQRQ